MSLISSVYIAVYLWWVETLTTLKLVAPLITWLFVSTSPEREMIIPVPAARPFS